MSTNDMTQTTCPNCGYCPHCGQSRQMRPYYIPPYYVQPWWMQPSITWTTAGAVTSGHQLTPNTTGGGGNYS